jgi:hypothetical protein
MENSAYNKTKLLSLTQKLSSLNSDIEMYSERLVSCQLFEIDDIKVKLELLYKSKTDILIRLNRMKKNLQKKKVVVIDFKPRKVYS